MNVLIIEDDLDFRQSLTKNFEAKGDRIFYISSIKELASFDFDQQIDSAIIDLRLGLESGIDFIERIREEYPKSYIVMLTAYGSITTSVDAIKKGADEYLLKPCRFKDLYETVLNREKAIQGDENQMLDLYQKEKEYIDFVMQQNQGNISKSAEVLGIRRQSLQRKLKKLTEKKVE